jgi:hypothetical protein
MAIEFVKGQGIVDTRYDKDKEYELDKLLYEIALECEDYTEFADQIDEKVKFIWECIEDSTHEHDDTDYDNEKQEA